MKHKQLVNKKLVNLESTLTTLKRIINRKEPISLYKSYIAEAEELVEEISHLVSLSN
jgi:hypothetical protein